MENKVDWLEAHFLADRVEKGLLKPTTLTQRLHKSLRDENLEDYLTMKVAQAWVKFNKDKGVI